jgi:hypothetical protein
MAVTVFTKQTSTLALVFFTFYFLYGMFYLPFTQYLVSLATGGIAYGISDSYEVAVIGCLLMNFLFPIFGGPGSNMKDVRSEGFTNPREITERIETMKKGYYNPEPVGVGSKMTEGFTDASESNMTLDANKKESENTKETTATTKPSPVEEASVPAVTAPPAVAATPTTTTAEKFQDNGQLFKLGQIPVDTKGGYHIDAGTTVMNAFNSLKPDQIKQMTMDTKQLLETQKSLMSMLQSFQPMLSEGKNMMTTFQTMFNPTTQGAAAS